MAQRLGIDIGQASEADFEGHPPVTIGVSVRPAHSVQEPS